MNNEIFLDILGELDDDLISDAAQPKAPATDRNGNIRRLFMIAAAVLIFIISGFILSENTETGNMGLYEDTSSDISDLTESETTEEPSVTAEETLLEPVTEPHVTSVITATDAPTASEPLTTSVGIITNPFLEPDVPSENPTSAPDENSTGESSASDNETTEPDLGLPPTEPPLMGDPLPEIPEYFFIEVPSAAFLEILPEDSPDASKYTRSETVPWHILEEIYGTRVLPDYIPSKPYPGPNLDSVPDNEIKNGEYTVYYSEDISEIYSLQEFNILTSYGILTVKASTCAFPLYKEEIRNSGSRSLVNNVPVLLLKGMLLGDNTVLNAQFQKDGIYFRVTLKGIDLSEDEFIKILESLI